MRVDTLLVGQLMLPQVLSVLRLLESSLSTISYTSIRILIISKRNLSVVHCQVVDDLGRCARPQLVIGACVDKYYSEHEWIAISPSSVRLPCHFIIQIYCLHMRTISSTAHFQKALSSRISSHRADENDSTPSSSAADSNQESSGSDTSKRFPCDHEGCFKVYKTPSGLRYHKQHVSHLPQISSPVLDG